MIQETRQIKFRAWIPSYNEVRYMPEPAEDYKDYISLRIARFFSTLDAEDTGHYIMQFTGLKDKNNKDIYEGDIVNQEKWVSVGKYVPSVGVVTYKGVGFTCDCVGEWEGSNADLNGNATVIGNIYENENLLHGK